jgi:hypothetical protein
MSDGLGGGKSVDQEETVESKSKLLFCMPEACSGASM